MSLIGKLFSFITQTHTQTPTEPEAMSSAASTSLHPLISPNLVDTKKYFCPFLERGYCREASRCNFSHDNCKSIKIPTDYCHFYLANQCLYGLDCKFRHTEPPQQQQQQQQPTPAARAFIATTVESHENATLFVEDCSDDYEECDESIQSYSNHLLNLETDHLQQQHQHQLLLHQSTSSTRAQALPSPDESVEPIPSASNSSSTLERLSTSYATSLPSISSTSSRPTTSSTSTFSYAKVCRSRLPAASSNPKKNLPLCPYTSETGQCEFPPGHCSYIHGLECDLCGRSCLHPYDPQQQRQHRDDCLKEHEREMELSFAIQRSKDKICGICMEIVVEKKPITSSRFGILEKCNHIFCLACIRKWRGTKQFETRTIRACPECRVSSDFVVPSKYWIEDQDDKDKLIGDYKIAMQSKSCKYFNEGKGECPFAGSCFYKHAYPDGSIAKMDTPKPKRKVFGARGPTTTVANYILWNILTSTDEEEWTDDELGSIYDGLSPSELVEDWESTEPY